MLKRNITYTDLDGNQVTEAYYFNLSKTDLIDMELSVADGFAKMLQRIINADDNRKLIQEFKKLILTSYGERSEDGRRFIKNEELSTAFSQTPAFDELFMEFVTSDNAAAEFIMAVIPADFAGEVKNAVDAAPLLQSTAPSASNPALAQFPPLPNNPMAPPVIPTA